MRFVQFGLFTSFTQGAHPNTLKSEFWRVWGNSFYLYFPFFQTDRSSRCGKPTSLRLYFLCTVSASKLSLKCLPIFYPKSNKRWRKKNCLPNLYHVFEQGRHDVDTAYIKVKTGQRTELIARYRAGWCLWCACGPHDNARAGHWMCNEHVLSTYDVTWWTDDWLSLTLA